MKHAWITCLWRKEPRADYVGQNVEYPFPVYKAHSVWMRQGPRLDPESFSIADAAGKNSRELAKQHNLDMVTCACGHEWPSCTHVTWNCASCVAMPEVTAPVSTSEERGVFLFAASTGRLGQQIVPMTFYNRMMICVLCFSAKPRAAEWGCACGIRRQFSTCPDFRRAAWSVAPLGQVISRQLQGVDQCIYTAEAVAVCKACIACPASEAVEASCCFALVGFLPMEGYQPCQ